MPRSIDSIGLVVCRPKCFRRHSVRCVRSNRRWRRGWCRRWEGERWSWVISKFASRVVLVRSGSAFGYSGLCLFQNRYVFSQRLKQRDSKGARRLGVKEMHPATAQQVESPRTASTLYSSTHHYRTTLTSLGTSEPQSHPLLTRMPTGE